MGASKEGTHHRQPAAFHPKPLSSMPVQLSGAGWINFPPAPGDLLKLMAPFGFFIFDCMADRQTDMCATIW